MSDEYVFGAHILESLTTGMYRDSRTIYREYVQNSCDAIDAAIKAALLQEGEGRIDIDIDATARRITITDNGTGIKSTDFQRVLGNIADSDKKQSEDRGFRGIGRLCGMAYCKTLRFTAKYAGESVISRLECDAGVLRELLHEQNSGISRYTASEVLGIINDFRTENANDIDGHYFRVELEGINDENTALLNFVEVKKYLSFVAPVPYSLTFDPFSLEIRQYSDRLGEKIDEYCIVMNGTDQVFKEYKKAIDLGRGKGGDEVYSLKFQEFRDINNELIAWMWFGVSNFRGAIDGDCPMRGIRLRKKNIQIGDEEGLRSFFTEPRGVNYFIGEIFCVSDGLIPNSQRDYFNENPECADFDKQLKNYFRELSRIYHDGSVISSAFKKINEADRKRSEFKRMLKAGDFADNNARENAKQELHEAEIAASQARVKIGDMKRKGSVISQDIIERIEKNCRSTPSPQEDIAPTVAGNPTYKQKLLNKVFDIIRATVDSHTADKLITAISDGLK